MYDVQSHFLGKPVLAFAFPIREIQTDNGTEWANAPPVKAPSRTKTLFEQVLEDMDIIITAYEWQCHGTTERWRDSIGRTRNAFTRR